jgi:hypothetical protein
MQIDWMGIDFSCPYCGKMYYDDEDKFKKRADKATWGYTRETCECGKQFGVSHDEAGRMAAFKLGERKLR